MFGSVCVCVCVFVIGVIRGLGYCVCKLFTVELGTCEDVGTYTQVPTFFPRISSLLGTYIVLTKFCEWSPNLGLYDTCVWLYTQFTLSIGATIHSRDFSCKQTGSTYQFGPWNLTNELLWICYCFCFQNLDTCFGLKKMAA